MAKPSKAAKGVFRHGPVCVKTRDGTCHHVKWDHVPGNKVFIWDEDGVLCERVYVGEPIDRDFVLSGAIGEVPVFSEETP